MSFSIQDIREALDRIAPYIIETPLLRMQNLDRFLGCQVYVKLENLQNTVGAFKLRGALNRILSCPAETLKKGVVAVSSGNHGKAVAYVAKMLGIPATIVIPDTAAKVKIEAIQQLGADVVLTTVTERFREGERIAKEKAVPLIHPYNDYAVMAGQGTAGLEIMEQQPDLDAVVVPMSGAGLIGGVSEAIKSIAPQVKVWGAEPAVLPKFTESRKAGESVDVGASPTIADALVSSKMGDLCFPVANRNVDMAADVDEAYILKGMKLLLMEGKLLAEPSSCIGMGGMLQGLYPVKPDMKVCFLISGGSVGFSQLEKLKDVTY